MPIHYLSRRNFLLQSCSLAALFWTSSNATERLLPKNRAKLGQLWSPTLFPWILATAFFQEDVAEGPVATHVARGIAPYIAKQKNWRFQPSKLPNNQGIQFDAFGEQHLTFQYIRDSIRLYRWCLAILRVKDDGQSEKPSQILNINFGKDASSRSPGIQYWPKTFGEPQLDMIWHSAKKEKGTVRAALSNTGFTSDGQTWNCCLTYRRNGRLFASVNGVDSGYKNDQKSWTWPVADKGPNSIIGGRSGLECEWAYDCIILGQTELTEATTAKLEGWAMWRAGRQSDLPQEHPYRSAHPVVDEEDFPYIYQFGSKQWLAWGATLANKSAAQSIGQPKQPDTGYERVFFDDFRSNSLADSDVVPNKLANWYAPGWNTAVGGSAQLLPPRHEFKLFSHNPHPAEEGIQSGGMLTLSLKAYKNRWYGPSIYSIDDTGKGNSWEGEAIFRLRCRAPKYDEISGGFFPAFWAYALQPLFLRHLERIEIDFWEFEGKNPYWINGGSSHVHAAHYRNKLGHLEKDAKRFKILGINMTPNEASLHKPLSFWDGQWHTWEFRIDHDQTYLNVILEVDGSEEWIELYRCATPKEFLERKYLIIDYALRANDGLPDPSRSHDIDIDFIEVLQKTRDLAAPSTFFKSLPKLIGEPVSDSTIECKIDLQQSIKDVWYHWYVDGYPRVAGLSPKFQLTAEDRGRNIRCMVRAVGAINQPEAWSNSIGPIV